MNASANNLPMKEQMTSSGFTLIELMVTIAVLAIIVSIAAPSISTQLANQRVKSTAATLENALKEAKAGSLIRRQPLTISFDDSSKVIRIQHIVLSQVKSTVATYKYNAQSKINASQSSNEFKPHKGAEAETYVICDSNNAANPITIKVSTTGIISNRLEGVCS